MALRRCKTTFETSKMNVLNPAYFAKIIHKSTNTGPSPLLDEQDLETFPQSSFCQHLPYACMTRLKIDRFLMEIDYLDELFGVVYRKFLTAIDHIEYHPTLQNAPPSEARTKCSVFFLRQDHITLLVMNSTPQKNYFSINFL